ncbi:hypothetical protein [Hyunsoonleella pacifica]|uniref:Uncharacterized protein n=1 Tax=Hyunsoonleella pacifica TaxID=1080224 RepID=A0A4V6MT88_9FLAO|nr:hypothetical protein [Hyunsoonleella pacifica]TBN17498.1 hypothetical protein EYD46_04060 [Hyunsoonleella pacifica]GGD11482.1 hypothetical protein GCM10011368_11810 [Hyunsoonleella pacifica]
MNIDYTTLLSYSINLFELLAVCSAAINYKKYKYSSESYFLHFLILTFIVDTILGKLVGKYTIINNIWLYYAYTGLSFLFYFWWYHTVLKNTLQKKVIILFSVLFLLVYFVCGSQVDYHKYVFVLGAVFLLVLTGFHLHDLINADDHALKIKYKLSFWITIALVLFNVGMIPFILLSKYFNVWIYNSAFTIILFFLNLILYGCYIIGFTWTKTKYNQF